MKVLFCLLHVRVRLLLTLQNVNIMAALSSTTPFARERVIYITSIELRNHFPFCVGLGNLVINIVRRHGH